MLTVIITRIILNEKAIWVEAKKFGWGVGGDD
jgi:hypothetical protein